MSGHLAKFLEGPEDGKVQAMPQDKPHPTIDFPAQQQSYWSMTDSVDLEAMVEVGRVRYQYLTKSRANPRLHYYEHVPE